nr:hypothetical protein [Nonomuraea diastatica]
MIDAGLRDDLDAPRKQRHTAKRIFDRLVDEHDATGAVSYGMHRISASAGQEALFEGHAHAFRILGGVPAGKIRYDNLKAAVASVIGFSRQRVEADGWTAFRSHYGIEAFYCQPGITGAHEKGGVEGDIGWFRRNHLVPMPETDSIEDLNAMVDAWDAADDERRIASRAHTVGALRHRTMAPHATTHEAVRDWSLVHPACGSFRAGHGPDEQVLRARALRRPASPGAATRLPSWWSTTAKPSLLGMSG